MEPRENILEKLKAAPDALLLIEELQKSIAKEAKERDKFYEIIHENHKAEFINGKIIFQSPVKKSHWQVSMHLSAALHTHVQEHQLGIVGVEKVMIHLTRNDYEPDICYFSTEKAKDFSADQMLFPTPDFIVEIISPSTESIDRNEKFIDYAAHGVGEYWIIDPEKQIVEQYTLSGKNYQLHQKLTKKGVLEAKIIKGFTIELSAIFS